MSLSILVILLGLTGLIWYYITYNSLISHRNAVDQSWSNTEVELKRRFDLIGNLISVVKGYTDYERETFQKIASLRTENRDKINIEDAMSLQKELNGAVTKILALSESYPELKADSQFINLQKELTVTENRIAERRSAYNGAVNMYLNSIQSFPSNLVADLNNFTERAFFDAEDNEIAKVPEVKLDEQKK